jgi:predicted nucleic acid-binding protein
MTILIDTGFLYATVDRGDINHRRVVEILPTLTDKLLLPDTILSRSKFP